MADSKQQQRIIPCIFLVVFVLCRGGFLQEIKVVWTAILVKLNFSYFQIGNRLWSAILMV